MDALVSAIPIALLFLLMLGFKMPSHWSALTTLIATLALALFVAPEMGISHAVPAASAHASVVAWSVVEGVLKAIFPILLIILMAIYSYNIVVASQAIETIKQQFTSITDDRGVLVLLMVWGFGGLLEGMAGFGTAVAIPAAILIGLGFKPMFSAIVALLGNTVPTGFGAVGVPITTLCNEISASGVADSTTLNQVSAFAIVQLAPMFFLVPFTILMLTDHRQLAKNILLALWTGGVSLAAQILCAFYLGPETPAIVGSLAAIVALIVWSRWMTRKSVSTTPDTKNAPTPEAALKAWSVYLFILFFIVVSGPLCSPINAFLKTHCVSEVNLSALESSFKFGWLSNAALMLLLGSVAGGLAQGLSPRRLVAVLASTVVNLRFTTVTIVSLISLASVMNHSGMISAMAQGLVDITGSLYPLFAPLIGAVGTFVTGSDTSSNILFAKLQVNVASKLGLTGTTTIAGVTGSEANWMAAANTTGATGGKMISPQSIAIATAACDMKGADDAILRRALPYAAAYIAIGGLLVYFG